MRISPLIIGFLLALAIVSSVSASSYDVTYSQVGSKLVVKEIVNGIEKEAYVDAVGLEKSGNNYYFVKKITFSQDFDSAQIKFALDIGVIIQDNEVYPAGYKIESDGKTITIIWDKINIKSGDDFAMFVSLKDTSANYTWIFVIIAGVIVLSGAYLFYKNKKYPKQIVRKSTKTKDKKPKEDVYDYLLDTEKNVIELLKKADRNELWQKQIQNSTGFSKAKVSRLVRNLEARNLVKKIPFGNTNKIRLR